MLVWADMTSYWTLWYNQVCSIFGCLVYCVHQDWSWYTCSDWLSSSCCFFFMWKANKGCYLYFQKLKYSAVFVLMVVHLPSNGALLHSQLWTYSIHQKSYFLSLNLHYSSYKLPKY